MKHLWRLLVALVFMAVVLAGQFASAAQNPATCDQRIRNAEHRLHRAVRRYGARSRQAQKRRQQLERVRSRCHM